MNITITVIAILDNTRDGYMEFHNFIPIQYLVIQKVVSTH